MEKVKHMSRLYMCYSVPLMKFLTEQKGIRYELVALSTTTQNKFWIFLRCDELHNALTEWKK